VQLQLKKYSFSPVLCLRAKRLDGIVKSPTDDYGDFHLPTRHQVSDSYALELHHSVRDLRDKLADPPVDLQVVDGVVTRAEGILREKGIL